MRTRDAGLFTLRRNKDGQPRVFFRNEDISNEVLSVAHSIKPGDISTMTLTVFAGPFALPVESEYPTKFVSPECVSCCRLQEIDNLTGDPLSEFCPGCGKYWRTGEPPALEAVPEEQPYERGTATCTVPDSHLSGVGYPDKRGNCWVPDHWEEVSGA